MHSPRNSFVSYLISALLCFGLVLSTTSTQADDPPNPYPAEVTFLGEPTVWNFPDDIKSWRAVRDCQIVSGASFASIRSTGVDPILVRSLPVIEQPFECKLTCRSVSPTSAQLFWDGSGKDRFNEKDSRRFEILGDGQWHDYSIKVDQSSVRSLRLDPANAACEIELKQIQLRPYRPAEFEISRIDWIEPEKLKVRLRSSASTPLSISVGYRITSASPAKMDQAANIELPSGGEAEVVLTIPIIAEGADSILIDASSGKTTCRRPCVRANIAERWRSIERPEERLKSWISLSNDQLSLSVAVDGSAATIRKRVNNDSNWQLAAYLAPLAWNHQTLERFTVSREGEAITASSSNAKLTLSLDGNKIHFNRTGPLSIEGPVVRIPGEIEQGLLAGVEHLGKAEASSSAIDIDTEDRFRFAPPPHHLTMQLAAVVNDANAVSLRWTNPDLQPVFATPNFFDGVPESRIALQAQELNATLVIGNGWNTGGRIEDCVLEYVQAKGLQPLPAPVRSEHDQDQLDWLGFSRSELLAKDGGWFHAIQPGAHGMPRNAAWFGDHASAVLALNKPLPVETSKLVCGGSHLANDRWMFLSGMADGWVASQKQQLQNALARQQSDGSVIYDGQWSVGHFEKTSSGQCGMLAEQLMKIALMTGDKQALEAGVKTLEYCKRFRTPRGAQVWECPLHAPDIMASAHLVRTYSIAYQLTGNPEYKQLAVRWALSGLPFVYQWQGSNSWNAMPYSTIATLCATHRVAPLWIGRPVQWCGIVYADALLDLAPIDKTLDWTKIAEGIYRSATVQQYTDGPNIGLLPDSVLPTVDRRFPLDINPATLVLVGHRLRSLPVQLDCRVIDGQHIVSPWPIVVEANRVSFQTPQDIEEFQIAINGSVRKATGRESLKLPLP